ncbi:formimidoylglutamate deiminase [Paracoccus yeei]|uniref:N-formimino-L-glutamate deiminase (HutF) n=2 Tax=Paracoccus yeei TaxID=147645 RepID=A0A0D5A1T3_9RHOB|nr:formimidoylglutamate deiminase [Paracoccus yeei]AJW30111.1 N-formimino-L-glutamate deiminase (HutF) [Paracoccus yeei]OWJ89967.1 formimidoylglutamate deiminase [Paracoccus yeei]PZT92429.1 MAG: formimidoylglutamate deiminase [Citromicrobium sp.]
MPAIWARRALLPAGWETQVAVFVGEDGRIAAVERGTAPPPGATVVETLLPAPANLHSHAFQRAMAGLTERRGPDPKDSFWTWRRLMYRFLDQLTPEDIEAIAAFVQMEMLEAGYATSVEFHYLHHDSGGRPYADLAEMSGRIAAAAAQTGIGLTLLPVLYQWGGLDRRALVSGQDRFGNTPERFARLVEGAQGHVARLGADSRIGIAPHSLRAVDGDGLAAAQALAGDGPIHMHLAEQTAEVDEVLATTGRRPVEWLLENLAVDQRWCLIHATQMTPGETVALARSGAVAGLCPITESSLGDGIFEGVRWTDAGGAFGIGSDSNIRISLSEELRTLDYSQRLRDRSRAALASADRSTGRVVFEGAARGGAQAAGRGAGAIEPGLWADLMALGDLGPDGVGREDDTLLDTWIFARDDRDVTDTWSAGRHLVAEGRHIRRAPITAAYARTLQRLRQAI